MSKDYFEIFYDISVNEIVKDNVIYTTYWYMY
jgi:hypothetical protein